MAADYTVTDFVTMRLTLSRPFDPSTGSGFRAGRASREPGSILTLGLTPNFKIKMDPGLTSHTAVENRRDDEQKRCSAASVMP